MLQAKCLLIFVLFLHMRCFYVWNETTFFWGLRLFLQMLFVCYEAICEFESMLCPVFYKSRVGAEGFKNLFPIFVPPTQNPKISKVHNRAGKNESVVCQTNFRAKNQKCVQSDWASKRAKRFSFQSRDWKDQKVWTKSSWWSEIPRDRLNIPNRSAVRWEKDQTVLSRASQLWIYIYIYVFIYSIYACSCSYRGDSLTKFLDL